MNGASSMMNYQYAIRYTLYAPRFTLHQDARTKKPFYAKQTQFPPILRQKRLFGRKTNPNKPNSKPIKPNSDPIQTQSNPIQTQSNPIFRSFYLAHAAYSPQLKPASQSVLNQIINTCPACHERSAAQSKGAMSKGSTIDNQ